MKGCYNKTDLVIKPDKPHTKHGKSSERKTTKDTDKITRPLRQEKVTDSKKKKGSNNKTNDDKLKE